MRVSFHTYPRGWPGPNGLRRLRRFWHQYVHGRAFREGMELCGVETVRGKWDRASDADVAVVWTFKQSALIEGMFARGKHVIVMERGFLPPRHEWVSLGLDGLNDNGRAPPPADAGERFERHFGHLLKPWKTIESDVALVIGQTLNGPAAGHIDFAAWAQEQTDRARAAGYRVVYRSHPGQPTPCPRGAEPSTTPALMDDVAAAAVTVSYNSTAAIASVLAGTPSVATDPSAVAYPVSAHAIEEPLAMPDRSDWCRDLSWRQWTIEELADGTAWRHFRQIFES